jgi:hypothetical protein
VLHFEPKAKKQNKKPMRTKTKNKTKNSLYEIEPEEKNMKNQPQQHHNILNFMFLFQLRFPFFFLL